MSLALIPDCCANWVNFSDNALKPGLDCSFCMASDALTFSGRVRFMLDPPAVTDLVPHQDKVFEAWLVDGNYAASGYPLSLGQFIKDGTLSYNENLVNAYTYTDIAVTMEPKDDSDPKPSWSNQVGVYLLSPPFGK